MTIYDWRTAPIDEIIKDGIAPAPRKNRGGNKRRYYKTVCAFDIETTRIDEKYSVMYIWQFQIGLKATVTGRTWIEFKHFCRRLRSELDPDAWLVIFVHNLSFEFQWLTGIYNFKEFEVFAIDERKPLRCDMWDCLEFRCSYLHSNMGLDEYLKKMGVQHEKVHGFDYYKERYPWTPLSDQELLYCINDVRGLVEAIMIEMEHDHDTLYSLPATSTGYVRRDVKKIMRSYPYTYVKDQLPDRAIYDMLRESFRGGNTHASRYYAGHVVEGVKSYDRSSSYPDVQCNCKFPVSGFIEWPGEPSLEQLTDLIGRRKKAVLMRIAVRNVRLKDELWGCPYLTIDKCRKLETKKVKGRTEPANYSADNGRILSAEYLETTFTDIDWKIFISEYDFDGLRIFNCYYARYGKLPRRIIDQIEIYYTLKTRLKGDDQHKILYDKSKAKLNSIYGMSAESPCRLSARYSNGIWDRDKSDTTPPPNKDGTPYDGDMIDYLLEKYNKRAWFVYAWGVWTSAWGRFRLEEGIRMAAAGADYPMDDPRFSDFVYCDTDSVKYIGNVDWSAYNEQRMVDSKVSGAYADDAKGVRHYMGVYEPDDGYPARFATRGAKKYVVQHPDGSFEATIAGVSKKSDPESGKLSGGEELMENGGFKAFLAPTFTFRKAGGTMLIYNDTDRFLVRREGRILQVRQCVTITEDFYTLKDTREYSELLEKSSKFYYQFRLDILNRK